ncbi:hypothetical protein A9Q02_18025 [Candidatus Chloroploca asiatica]|uniref:site-specific DNA-methyltransferase (adenine-specific) n=2 Tax=Candidatus Chloroploca asiatica TaxID=1506545 RepID=A0A2H3KQP2_9CHLR|nr:hypothetical protein A9Q02_18025 [Candidatus Chloroploca asiatica]
MMFTPMSAAQLSLALAQRHYNRQLFADRYLDVTLPQREDWLALRAEAIPVLAQVRALLAAFTPSNNEAQTEHDLVRPVLLALGHSFEVQAALRTPKGTKKPDYVFYCDQAALNANKGRVLTDADFGAAFAVGDAKHWERKLDVSSTGESDEINKVPADQIAFYMRHSGVAWGILTNGRFWRLYHKDTVHKQDRFYEVDLRQLAESGDVDAFLYFYAFFRREAFNPPAAEPLALEAMLRESSAYARGVSESLKAQVFDALRHLAQGLLDYPGNRLEPTPETLREVYSHSLIVLYRLLFIFYAEARELLPLRASAAYREDYSLAATVRQVVRRLDSGLTLLADTGRTWARLRDLFHIINGGSPPLQVATFNGGLFDPQRHPFLERYTIGDAQLQRALDKLARVEKEQIDYRDLAERHLGTIYEGLLEYHLQPIAPTSDGFTLDLFNDKGERHRTGSYYTPDFVVQYIVEQTIRPLLEEAVAGQTTDEAKIAAVLAVNCLDPAMGSGHFPVAATEYIARYLVELGVQPPAEAGEEPDLVYWKRRVAQSCIYGVDLNPLAVDLAKLSLWLATAAKGRPLSFLDHHLRCGNALVGARATEVAASKPVKQAKRSKKEVAAAQAGQLSMLEDPAFAGAMSSAVGSMWLIEGSAGRTVAEVKEQEHLYELIRRELTERFAVQADLRTADDFAQAPDQSLWPSLLAYASKRESGAFAMPAYEPLLAQVRALAEAQRFLHWDLEFPEVFFDRHGRPLGEQAGFDAIIGNPPYVRQEQLGPLKPYLQRAYPETYSGTADLFVSFFHQGVKLLRHGGRLGYITTNKWLRAGYGEGLRAYFASHATIERIIDFGHAPIFEGADVFPVIIVVTKPSADADLKDHEVQVTSFPRDALGLVSLDSYVARYSHPVPQHRLGRNAWSLEQTGTDALIEKIRCAGIPLIEYAGVKPFYGIKTGFNEAFLIDTPTKTRLVQEDPRSEQVIKPYLRGQDIKRWTPEWQGLWMIVLKSSENNFWPWSHTPEQAAEIAFREHYPSLYAFMKPMEVRLRARQDKGHYWWELRSCAYYEAFEKPKVMYQVIQFHSQYGIDKSQAFTNDKGFFIPVPDHWLLAVLNSPLMWWHNWRYLPHMKDEALNPAGFLIEKLPIAPANDATREVVAPAVDRLIAITRAGQQARRDTLDWLRSEFDIATPGQKLAEFSTLSEPEFIEEVKKRRPKASGKLSPAGLRALRDGYAEQAKPVQQHRAEALGLERRLAELVNAAYGLTPEDVALLWETAPPRMPVNK